MSRNDATATAPDLSLPGERMLNRELSRLDFNARVLAQAAGWVSSLTARSRSGKSSMKSDSLVMSKISR